MGFIRVSFQISDFSQEQEEEEEEEAKMNNQSFYLYRVPVLYTSTCTNRKQKARLEGSPTYVQKLCVHFQSNYSKKKYSGTGTVYLPV